MGQISAKGLKQWIKNRILAFLNRAKDVQDITGPILKDDPMYGSGSDTIGGVVAGRILEKRNELPGHQFTDLSQLNGIQGLGEDKFQDLIYTFSTTAADSFKNGMEESVILDNWILEYFKIEFESDLAFEAVVDNPKEMQKLLKFKLTEVATDKYGDSSVKHRIKKQLKQACLEPYSNGHVGSYALALWYYRFDADNWFSFEQVQEQAELYLDFMTNYDERIELRLYKGFDNRGIVSQPITVQDLVVVVNYNEKVVTIWSAQLND